jgi:hypothetical protein
VFEIFINDLMTTTRKGTPIGIIALKTL